LALSVLRKLNEKDLIGEYRLDFRHLLNSLQGVQVSCPGV